MELVWIRSIVAIADSSLSLLNTIIFTWPLIDLISIFIQLQCSSDTTSVYLLRSQFEHLSSTVVHTISIPAREYTAHSTLLSIWSFLCLLTWKYCRNSPRGYCTEDLLSHITIITITGLFSLITAYPDPSDLRPTFWTHLLLISARESALKWLLQSPRFDSGNHFISDRYLRSRICSAVYSEII